MPLLHPLLLRQLRRLGIPHETQPNQQQWSALLERIGRAYAEADQERYLLDRSQEVSSREMRELYRRLEEAQRIAGLGYWTLDFDGRSGFWSEESYRLAGLDPLSPVPTYRGFLDLVHPADRDWVDRTVRTAMRQGNNFSIEFRFLHADATVRWVSVSGHRVMEEGRPANRLTGSVLDVTRRKEDEETMRSLNTELERRVAERTRQLEAANHELQSFSYSVSHDLRAPLRAINGFAQLLAEAEGERLGADSKEHLQRIVTATVRMGDLIDGLLALSRISRKHLSPERIDLSRIGADIAEDLRRAEPERQAVIDIEPNLTAHGDPVLVRSLLENLLRNAWKFTGRNPQPRISLSAARLNGEEAFAVRDNGVGFDMRFATQLFKAFSRIHSPTEFPGTGIGLATVQRIVNAHDGKIEVDSKPGEGTIFTIALGSDKR